MMIWKASEDEKSKRKCIVCEKSSPLNHYLVFNELKGCPVVCALCLFKGVTGMEGEWSPGKVSPVLSSMK